MWPEYRDGISEIPGAVPCVVTDFLCDLGQVIKCFGKTGLMIVPLFSQAAVKINVLKPFMRGPYKYSIKHNI